MYSLLNGLKNYSQRTGLGDGRGFENRQPITEADLKTKVEDNN